MQFLDRLIEPRALVFDFQKDRLIENGYSELEIVEVKQAIEEMLANNKSLQLNKNKTAKQINPIYIEWDLSLFPKSPKAFEILCTRISLATFSFFIEAFGARIVVYSHRNDTNLNITDTLIGHSFFFDLSNINSYLSLMHKFAKVRGFNSFSKIGHNDFLEKRSSEKPKLRKEFNFLTSVSEIKEHLVEAWDYKESLNDASYKMSKVLGSDVARLYLSNRLSDEFIESLFDFFKIYFKAISTSTKSNGSLSDFLIRKNIKRFKELKKNRLAFDKLNKALQNFSRFNKIDDLLDKVNYEIKSRKSLVDFYPNTAVHGDLCFSNIITNPRAKSGFTLVDPRGWGDKQVSDLSIVYDFAKLSHSILGEYDSIVRDQVNISFDDNLTLLLNFPPLKGREKLRSKFKSLLKVYKIDLSTIRLVESSLFLSMLPLHSESSTRQLKFIYQAVKIIENEIM